MNINDLELEIVKHMDQLYVTSDMLINIEHKTTAVPFDLIAMIHEKATKYNNLLTWIHVNKSWAEKCWNVYATDNQLDSVYDIDDDYLFLFLELYGNTKEHT